MKKIEIITDEHRHHVYVGNTDFWLDTQELVELYKKLGHIKLYLSWKKRVINNKKHSDYGTERY